MADTLSKLGGGDVASFEEFVKFCRGPEKLPGFSTGAAQHGKEFFDTGTSPELMVGGGAKGKEKEADESTAEEDE